MAIYSTWGHRVEIVAVSGDFVLVHPVWNPGPKTGKIIYRWVGREFLYATSGPEELNRELDAAASLGTVWE